jgi:tRNA nucleotidyltransferase/poly(A) polymerase
VLYQLPCYCRCDRHMGHTSLHSCFEDLHGAECSTCAKEGYYAYQMSLKGKTVREIREGVMRRDFESIDLNAIGL